MSLQDSRQISKVKVMLIRGADGKSIESIEKTGTSGAVDTYTITYSDGTKDTFTITNGTVATAISYDHSHSGLAALTVQEAIDELSDEVFVLKNQSLNFSNLVATISDARVTASTYAEVYFTDACLQSASNAGIVVDTSSGTITFTVYEAPETTLVCDIVCRKG